MKKRYVVKLPPDLHLAIKVRAAETGMSISGLVEGWARAGLAGGPTKANAKLRRAQAVIRALWAEACSIGDQCGQGVSAETRLTCELVVGEKLSDEPWKEG